MSTSTQQSVNTQGKKEILEFLRENHKNSVNDAEYFNNAEMLNAWAKDAEFQLSEGNTPSIEIMAFEAISGRTEEFTISDAGLDSEIVEIEE